MNMQVSGVCSRGEEKIAYVLFEEETRSAEGVIPECKIVRNKGFSDEEVSRLEEYMRENLGMLKRHAASVNPITALMKD